MSPFEIFKVERTILLFLIKKNTFVWCLNHFCKIYWGFEVYWITFVIFSGSSVHGGLKPWATPSPHEPGDAGSWGGGPNQSDPSEILPTISAPRISEGLYSTNWNMHPKMEPPSPTTSNPHVAQIAPLSMPNQGTAGGYNLQQLSV